MTPGRCDNGLEVKAYTREFRRRQQSKCNGFFIYRTPCWQVQVSAGLLTMMTLASILTSHRDFTMIREILLIKRCVGLSG